MIFRSPLDNKAWISFIKRNAILLVQIHSATVFIVTDSDINYKAIGIGSVTEHKCIAYISGVNIYRVTYKLTDWQ